MAPLRIGIVGSRFAAHLHLLAYRRVYGVDVRLAGVTSPTAERRDAFARESGATPYPDLEALLPHVDVVDVCSPPATHEPVALRAIEAGKHVVIEKPFTGAFGPASRLVRGQPRGQGGASAGRAGQRRPDRRGGASGEASSSATRRTGSTRRPSRRSARSSRRRRPDPLDAGRRVAQRLALARLRHLAARRRRLADRQGLSPAHACLYLKAVEGRARDGRPIRPATVSCRVHEITRLPAYRDRGFLRTDYEDVEDYSQLHVTFEDGTVADVFATELVLGGVHNWLEVFANNHRTTCRLNPVNLLDTYNPEAAQFRDVYVVEKIGTKEGWSHPAADEEWQQGFHGEIQDFVECCVSGRRPQSDAELAHDTVATLYAGYVSAERGGAEVPVPVRAAR